MAFLKFYCSVIVFLIVHISEDCNSLFCNWNKASIQSLRNSVNETTNYDAKRLQENRLLELPITLEISIDSLNKKSRRWKFIEQISRDFNWDGKNWIVIEVTRSGERLMILNYLIYYDNSRKTTVIKYEYNKGERQKEKEEILQLKGKDFNLEGMKVPYGTGNYPHDVIISNFKSGTVLHSEYFLPTSLSDKYPLLSLIRE